MNDNDQYDLNGSCACVLVIIIDLLTFDFYNSIFYFL